MKSRLLVAAVGVPLVLVILVFLPPVATAVFVALLTAVAAHELCGATGKPPHAFTALTMLCAVWIQVCLYFGAPVSTLAIGALLYFLLLFVLWVAYHERDVAFGFIQFGAGLMGGLVVPLCLGSLTLLRLSDNGVFCVLVPFVIAFIGDAGALFSGMLFGKHKLAPKTSPKKTVEGAAGGLVCSALFMVVYGLVLRAFDVRASLLLMALWGVCGGVVSQLGDLAFSLIKREFGIKDYGRILPGHGGVLDRFDSMVTLAPAIVLFFSLARPF